MLDNVSLTPLKSRDQSLPGMVVTLEVLLSMSKHFSLGVEIVNLVTQCVSRYNFSGSLEIFLVVAVPVCGFVNFVLETT